MYKYDEGIIDNFNCLKSVSDVIGKESYNELIQLWKDQTSESKLLEFLNGITRSDCPPNVYWICPLCEALCEISSMAEELLKDELFGIFIGLYPIQDPNDNSCYLPAYFIFRCSNNGRSLIMSEIKLHDMPQER